jgi:hypothetical protein
VGSNPTLLAKALIGQTALILDRPKEKIGASNIPNIVSGALMEILTKVR